LLIVQVNGFYGLPQWKHRFGTLEHGKHIVPAHVQTTLGNLVTCGQLVGLIITGLCQERFGAKKTFIGGMGLMAATVFIAVFAQNLSMLMAAEFCLGVPWGMLQTLTTAYASGECVVPQLYAEAQNSAP
jgi:SP family general alpha glucoside:H+ symporter-like MFS transporter